MKTKVGQVREVCFACAAQNNKKSDYRRRQTLFSFANFQQQSGDARCERTGGFFGFFARQLISSATPLWVRLWPNGNLWADVSVAPLPPPTVKGRVFARAGIN